MKITTPTFKRPIKSLFEPKVNGYYWDMAIQAYDNKQYRESVINVINYINFSVLQNVDTSKDFTIKKGQGSAEIQITVTSTNVLVKAPFVKITKQTNKIPLFRKAAELNFSPLTIAQIHLANDRLYFESNCLLELANPYKIYDILREISINADHYDDEFVEKFNTDFYSKHNGTSLNQEQSNEVWQQIETIRNDYLAYSQAFKQKQKDGFQWDIIMISILKLANMPYIQGTLRTQLQEYVNNMFNSRIDFNYRVDKGTSFMKKLCGMSREEFMKDIYHSSNFISLRWRSSKEILQNEARNMEKFVRRYQKDNNNFLLSYYLQSSLLDIVYKYNLETNHQNMIYDVLEEVSGLEHYEAASKMVIVYECLLQGALIKANENTQKITQKKPKKGFFAKLFS